MTFPVTSLVKKIPAAPSKTTSTKKLLERYAEFDIDAQQQMAKGERGIVVLSINGDEPIFAPVREYYTSDDNGAKDKKDLEGLAGIARQYSAEQKEVAGLTAESRTVSFDVLFDAESPEEGSSPCLGKSFQ
jgi:hypothetical protein